MIARPAWSLPLLALGLGAAPVVRAEAPGLSPPGAAACSGCHASTDHKSPIPSLERLTAGEIEASMLAFRAGERAPTVMDRIARGFTPEEIHAIAAWHGRR